MKRIKLAIICHLSCSEIRKELILRQGRHYSYPDYARWNTTIINALQTHEEIELHVISPHRGMCNAIQEFEHNGVCYHFYAADLIYPWGYLEEHLRIQKMMGFRRSRKRVKGFVNAINPDVVILIGAENPYYSITALDIENRPIFLHCQTVYANPDRLKNAGNVDKYRWNIELKLFRKIPYMAVSGRMYYDLIKGYESKAIIFPRRWPVSKFPLIPDVEKKYDFVYWARYLSRNKGFDNAIEAMMKFAVKYPTSKFLAVGEKDGDWPLFEKKIEESDLKNQLEIHPPIRDYCELLKYVKQGRFALLPITMDVLSGTILEAMRMRMPVVTCRTSGTPSLNEKNETVLLSDIGDCESLFQNMEELYKNAELQEKLVVNAEIYLREKDQKSACNADIMVDQLKAVVAHYYNGIPIPKELLFNTEDNKDYRKR
jgi:glycosyltransferase involved in cell wall biosynthesis